MQIVMKSFQGPNEVSTTMTIEPTILYTSRFISNKMVKLMVPLDGANIDLITKCDRINELSNDIYITLSEVQSGS